MQPSKSQFSQQVICGDHDRDDITVQVIFFQNTISET